VELLEPLSDGFLSRFLEDRGEGLHHVTFKTDDIGAAIASIEAAGYELVDVNIDDEHWKEAFLRPSKAHGTLIQVAQSSAPDDVAKDFLRPSNLDELLS
jgi:methylmalonyl-CoA/ethylmalonyl-CoA epimerase